jgi:hypothetical protein
VFSFSADLYKNLVARGFAAGLPVQMSFDPLSSQAIASDPA